MPPTNRCFAGRGGNSWESPAGCLMFSVCTVLTLPGEFRQCSDTSLVFSHQLTSCHHVHMCLTHLPLLSQAPGCLLCST